MKSGKKVAMHETKGVMHAYEKLKEKNRPMDFIKCVCGMMVRY